MVRYHCRHPVQDAMAVGDLVSLSGPRLTPHAVTLDRCIQTTLDDITVHASTAFGVRESFCRASTYRHVRVVPGAPPVGASRARLLSSNADGIHSINARQGPVVEHCTIRFPGDDGIAIHGEFALIVRVLRTASGAPSQLIVSPENELAFQAGDHLRFYAPNLKLLGVAIAMAIEPVAPRGADSGQAAQRRFRPQLRTGKSGFARSYCVTLDQQLELTAGDLASSPDDDGSGFVVRGNEVANGRARGIRVKAGEGLIEHNAISGMALSAIAVSPEPTVWFESDFAHNLEITGNCIDHTGYAMPDPNNLLNAGAITVASAGPAPAAGHQGILIQANVFTDIVGPAVVVTSARDVRILDNRFSDPNPAPGGTGRNVGVDSAAVVWISETAGVQVAGNRCAGHWPVGRTPLVVTGSVRDVNLVSGNLLR